jgi:hypothetical protein
MPVAGPAGNLFTVCGNWIVRFRHVVFAFLSERPRLPAYCRFVLYQRVAPMLRNASCGGCFALEPQHSEIQ